MSPGVVNPCCRYILEELKTRVRKEVETVGEGGNGCGEDKK